VEERFVSRSFCVSLSFSFAARKRTPVHCPVAEPGVGRITSTSGMGNPKFGDEPVRVFNDRLLPGESTEAVLDRERTGTSSAVMESDSSVRRSSMICGLMAVAGLLGQNTDRPRFARDHVLPYQSSVPRLLTRGQFVSIYGWSLAPRRWCGEPHMQQEPYPAELCGVRVLVGGHPAGLM
jgi:hypothetical protein